MNSTRIHKSVVAAVLAVATTVVIATPTASAQTNLSNETDSLTCAVATMLGTAVRASVDNIQRMGVKLNSDLLNETVLKTINGEATGFTAQEADRYISDYFERNSAPRNAIADPETEQKFLDDAAQQKNAVRTASGLVVVTLQKGSGVKPTTSDRVAVLYKGELSDGTVFDQTDDMPVEFDVDRVTDGFKEGLQLMQQGGKYILVMPAELGYGKDGIPGVIPGGAVLKFEVELKQIIPIPGK